MSIKRNDREIARHLGRKVNINFTVRFSDKQVAFGRQKRETSTSKLWKARSWFGT